MLGEKYFRPLRKAPWTFCAQGRNRAKGSVSALFRDRAHGSAAANPAGQHGARGDCFSRLAREVPAPRHEVSHRREMRFHRVISLESRISRERRRGARRDAFGNCGPPQVCLGSLRRGENPCEARAADAPEKNGIRVDGHAGDQGPRGRVRQGRGLSRHQQSHQQMRVQDGVPEARGLHPLPLRREKAVQVLPPVQPALPRVRGAEVREAREVPVRLQRMRTIVGSPIDIASCDLLATKVNARSCATRGQEGHGASNVVLAFSNPLFW